MSGDEALSRRGSADEFELFDPVGPLSWADPNDVHDDFGVRSQSLGTVASLDATGFTLDSRLGDAIPVQARGSTSRSSVSVSATICW